MCGAFLNPAAAYEYAKSNRLDAAFLDVEMPQFNGMKLEEALRELSEGLEIVMVTGYDQYAVEAYDPGRA